MGYAEIIEYYVTCALPYGEEEAGGDVRRSRLRKVVGGFHTTMINLPPKFLRALNSSTESPSCILPFAQKFILNICHRLVNASSFSRAAGCGASHTKQLLESENLAFYVTCFHAVPQSRLWSLEHQATTGILEEDRAGAVFIIVANC